MSRKESEADGEKDTGSTRRNDADRNRAASTEGSNPVAALHRSIGNQAVRRLARAGVAQPKLTVSSPSDPAEREAEAVAERIVEGDGRSERGSERGADGSGSEAEGPSPSESVPRSARGGEAPDAAESVVRGGIQGDGEPLPASTRSTFESMLGADFSDVRVHTDETADRAARSIDAEAYTMGSDIAFADGNYETGSKPGQRLLAHELTHVVQQGGDTPRRAGASVQRQTTSESGTGGGGGGTTNAGPQTTTDSSLTGSGSVSHEGGQGKAEGSRSQTVEGKNYNVQLEQRAALNGLINWEVTEAGEGQYRFTITIGLSGSLGGSGQFQVNQGDKAFKKTDGSASGSAEGGVSGGVKYSLTKTFGEKAAARYQRHLRAIENTPVEDLLNAYDYPEFDLIARVKALSETDPSKFSRGLAGVMGDPEAVEVLEPGESYSLETSGGWNVSLSGTAGKTAQGLSLGVGATFSTQSKWEKTVDVKRVEKSSDEERTQESGGGSKLREIVNTSLFFDTGKSDPLVGEAASANREAIAGIRETLGKIQEYGSPDTVEIDIAGHASQRWRAAEGSTERQAKNKALSQERVAQTEALLQNVYTESADAEAWPQPQTNAFGSLDARMSFPSGFDTSTDIAYYRRSDVIMQISEPQPKNTGSDLIRIKVGFSEASESEGGGSFSVGAAGGGVSTSKAESESIVSTFEIPERLSYFDDLYEALVNVSTPEELQKIQEDEVYFQHWTETELESDMEKMTGADFEIGGAKVSLRYGGLSEGSWTVGKGGIKAGERTAGQKNRGTISVKGHDLFQAGTAYTADIEKIPGGFEVSIQEIYGFQSEHLEGTMLSPQELSIVAGRATNRDQWMDHVVFGYDREWHEFSADKTSRDYWEELRQKLVNPRPAHLKENDKLRNAWQTLRKRKEAIEKEKGQSYEEIETEFENCARANAIADFMKQAGDEGKASLENMFTNWAYGSDVGLPFEFPDVMSGEKETFEEIRHVKVPAYLALARNAISTMEAGGEIPEKVREQGREVSDMISEMRTTILENEAKFAESENMAKMLGALDDMTQQVTEKRMALYQIQDWDSEGASRDFGQMAINRTIMQRQKTVRAIKDRFERRVRKAYNYSGSLQDYFTKTGGNDMISDETPFFAEWGEQVDKLLELYEASPRYDASKISEYVSEDDVWETYEWILREYDQPFGWTPEERRQELQAEVEPN